MGWLPKFFPKAGFTIVAQKDSDGITQKNLSIKYKGKFNFEAAEKFFDIPEYMSNYLFHPSAYLNSSKRSVIRRIDLLLRGKFDYSNNNSVETYKVQAYIEGTKVSL
jgi:hypothetical protein